MKPLIAEIKDVWFRTVFEAAPDALILINREGQIVLVNDRVGSLFGYKKEELLGQASEILVPRAIKESHRLLTENYLADPVLRPMGKNRDLHGRHKNGNLIPVEISLSPSPPGEPFFVVAAVRDVTERKRHEQLIKQSEQNFKTFFEICPVGAALISKSRKILRVNRAFLALYGINLEAEVLGTDLSLLMKVEQWKQLEEILTKIENGKTPQQGLFHQLRVDGVELWVRVNFSLVHIVDSEGQVVFCTFLDVTDMKSAERELSAKADQLAEQNKKLEEFTSVASHDLKAPARRASLYIQMIERVCGDALDEKGREYLKAAVSESKSMQALIDDLLDYSHMCCASLQLQGVSLNRVLADTLEVLRPEIEANGAKVTVGELPTVNGNEFQLRRLFVNLIANGLKFNRQVPKVTISAVTTDQCLEVLVSDNGVGIPAQDLQKIFDVFYRGRSQSEFPGTGLGLASCKRIMENHGGSIAVKSEIELGSTFYLRFPIAADGAD